MKKLLVFTLSSLPLFYLLFSVQSAADPIKYIYTFTGLSALAFLLLTLSVSPLKKVINFMIYRRMLGLFALFYATLHFLNFFVLDAQFDFGFVIKESLQKPFIYLGQISFLILIFMGITSTKKLFAKYNSWHKLVYIALIFVVIHEVMAQKVNGFLEYFFITFTAIVLLVRVYAKFIAFGKNRVRKTFKT